MSVCTRIIPAFAPSAAWPCWACSAASVWRSSSKTANARSRCATKPFPSGRAVCKNGRAPSWTGFWSAVCPHERANSQYSVQPNEGSSPPRQGTLWFCGAAADKNASPRNANSVRCFKLSSTNPPQLLSRIIRVSNLKAIKNLLPRRVLFSIVRPNYTGNGVLEANGFCLKERIKTQQHTSQEELNEG